MNTSVFGLNVTKRMSRVEDEMTGLLEGCWRKFPYFVHNTFSHLSFTVFNRGLFKVISNSSFHEITFC